MTLNSQRSTLNSRRRVIPRRRVCRRVTRLLNGARRRQSPNYLNLLCSVYNELLRLGKIIRPWMQEELFRAEGREWAKTCEAALNKVYGPLDPNIPEPLPQPRVYSEKQKRQILRDQKALDRLKLRIAYFKDKLNSDPNYPPPTRAADFQSAVSQASSLQNPQPVKSVKIGKAPVNPSAPTNVN